MAATSLSCADDPPRLDAMSAPSPQIADAPKAALPTVPDPEYLCGQPDPGPGTLLDLGHGEENVQLAGQSATRVLSLSDHRWILWDIQTRTQVASGTFPTSWDIFRASDPHPAALAGDIALVPGPSGGLQLRHASDGGVLSPALTSEPEWTAAGIARDASYVWGANGGALTVASLDGRILARRTGVDWTGRIAAEPDVLRLADLDSIVAIDVPSGEARMVGHFLGDFTQWFPDGSHFLTRAGELLRVYTADATLVTTWSVRWYSPGTTWEGKPPRTSAGGYGDYVWAQTEKSLLVYRLSEGRQIQSFALDRFGIRFSPKVVASGSSVALFQNKHMVRLVLRDDAPSLEERDFPASHLSAFATDADARWTVVGSGVLYSSIHADHPAGPLPTGCGALEALTGSLGGVVAISTSDGRVRIFDLRAQAPRLILTLRPFGSRVSLSRDGKRMLVDVFEQVDDGYSTLHLIDLPQGKIVHSFPHRDWDSLQRIFGLSPAGDTIVRVLRGEHGQGTVHVTRDDGTLLYPPVSLTDAPWNELMISPDGKRLALTERLSLSDRPSLLIEEGTAPRAIPGLINGWIDNARIILSKKEEFHAKTQFLATGSDAIVDLPIKTSVGELSVIDPEHVLSLAPFRIFHIPDGSAVWTGSGLPIHAAVAGDDVVFDQDGSIGTKRWR